MTGVSSGSREHGAATVAAAAFLVFVAALPWSIAAMSIGLGLCGLATVLAWVIARPAWRPPWPLLAPAVAWLLALAIAALAADDRAASLPRIAKGALPAIAWMVAYHARERRLAERALAVLLTSAAAVALIGLAVWIGKGAAFPVRARGAGGHYMTFAGQLLLWISLASGIAFSARGRWRLGAAAAAAIGSVALAATFTRSAWIGLVVSWSVMLALTRPRRLLGLAALVALLIAFAPASYRARLASAFDPHHATNIERTYMWQAGIAMFRDHPLTGVGLEDLHPIYERYKPAAAREPAGHLHSVFIQIAATMGVVGLAAFVWLYGSLFLVAGPWRSLRAGGLAAGVRLGVTGALAGFLVAGLFEWNFGDEELVDLLFTLVGLAWAARGWTAAGGSEGDARA